MFGSAFAAAGAAAVGAVAGRATTPDRSPSGPDAESFHGIHQAGIATAAQSHALFFACDIARPDRTALRDLLAAWTATAAALAAGHRVPEKPGTPAGFSAHTDFATGLGPARLTITFGLGPGIFGDRFGIGDRRPAHLRPLPEFAGDALHPAWCGGDVLAQICADDAQIVSHAFRALRARMPGLARMRWTQQGFLGRPADGGTPRNMFGHKDGTANPAPGSPDFERTVWVDAAAEPSWFRGGTYLVFRKIRMRTAEWDQLPTVEQDGIIGRRRGDGAPLGGHGEFEPIDLDARSADGDLAIPADAHVRLVHGIPMLRRGYNYDYGVLGGATAKETEPHDHPPGTDPNHTHGGHDQLDVGLLFAAYMNNPPDQFVKAQRMLAATDRLNGLIQHTGSALFAVPPGVGPGEPIAAALEL
ncbi:dye decolorizing peroxidase/deferrochelatase/peroxidase EfeB [Nocardia mexicana]|uniref:Dye decolorizing peroxidase/deferrochelatase/peroxidase EfeB n=2 Tax=Nocardia mexicana TaxID=279262 RepID=A0A370GR73_9NOCA|nr:dye decolorizing peroxidase/deferrochelatase/peroxidase EfeB [Nocardia mexicana]